MNNTHSDRVREHFVASARNLTPASARHSARVLFAPLSRDPAVTRFCSSILSSATLKKADRFVSEVDRDQFIQRRAFRNFCGATMMGFSGSLSQVFFDYTEKGRPRLSGQAAIGCSFSSCRLGFLGAWSSTHAIGIDIEEPASNVEAVELARHYYSEAEAKVVEAGDGPERLQSFFRLWSLKEAALKSIGEGLPFGLDAFRFELAPNLSLVDAPAELGGAACFDAYLLDAGRPFAALVTGKLIPDRQASLREKPREFENA